MDSYYNYYPKSGRNILIIGSGIVGGATGMGFSIYHNVAFVDISEQVISTLRDNNFKAYHLDNIPEESYDYIFICLPTPYNSKRKIQDMSIVKSSVNILKKVLEYSIKPTLVVRSTVLPGTSRDIIDSLENITGMKEGRDFYFCINPEFLRAKTALKDFLNPWAVVIGSDNKEAADKLACYTKILFMRARSIELV